MDIADFKKHAIPKIESGKIVNVIRQTIKEVQNREQDQYEKQKEVYKPIVEKLEQEIDEISDLRENMLKTANKSLTSPGKLAITDGSEKPAKTDGSVNKIIFDLDTNFTTVEKDILKKHNLLLPSEVLKESFKDDSVINKILKTTGQLNQKLGGKKSKKDIAVIKKYRENLEQIEPIKKKQRQ